MRLLHEPSQPPEIAAAIGSQRRFQFSRLSPSGDQVRIGVFFSPSRPNR